MEVLLLFDLHIKWEEVGHTPQELIKKLQATAKELDRTPARRELLSISDMCIRAFGSWNKALEKAGLVPHRSHSNRMYRRTSTVALDGHRCDSISEAIIDNWLLKKNIKHVRDAAYPETASKTDWKTVGGVFIEYFGLANDSPRYDRSIKKKREICKKYGIKLIEIYPTDLYPSVRLDPKFKSILRPLQSVPESPIISAHKGP